MSLAFSRYCGTLARIHQRDRQTTHVVGQSIDSRTVGARGSLVLHRDPLSLHARKALMPYSI